MRLNNAFLVVLACVAGFGLAACQAPLFLSTEGTSLELNFQNSAPSTGIANKSLSGSSPRLLLPTAATITVNLVPVDSSFPAVPSQSVAYSPSGGSNSVVFTHLKLGAYIVTAKVFDAGGTLILQQTATVNTATGGGGVTLSLVPASTSLTALAANSQITGSLGVGSGLYYSIPVANLGTGAFNLIANADPRLQFFAQGPDGGALASSIIGGDRIVSATVALTGPSFLTLYNPTAQSLNYHLVLNGSFVSKVSTLNLNAGNITLQSPSDICSDGTYFYVSDFTAGTVRILKIDPVAATVTVFYSLGATYSSFNSICIDSAKTNLLAYCGTGILYQIPLNGAKTSTFTLYTSTASATLFSGLCTDGTNFYAVTNANSIAKIAFNGTTYVSSNLYPPAGTPSLMTSPSGIALVGTNLYVGDTNTKNPGIYQISIAQQTAVKLAIKGITPVVPSRIQTDGSSLYYTDTNQINALNLTTLTGTVLAGSSTAGSTDGFGTKATLSAPSGFIIAYPNLYLYSLFTNVNGNVTPTLRVLDY